MCLYISNIIHVCMCMYTYIYIYIYVYIHTCYNVLSDTGPGGFSSRRGSVSEANSDTRQPFINAACIAIYIYMYTYAYIYIYIYIYVYIHICI